MIQRKQTIWLLLAALISACVFFFDLYFIKTVTDGVETITHLRVNDHFPTLLIALIMIILPVVTIFMFKNRKRQRNMAMVSLLATISFIAMVLMRANTMNETATGTGEASYWIGSVLPVISIIFLILAIIGINKDEKMVRASYDRLR